MKARHWTWLPATALILFAGCAQQDAAYEEAAADVAEAVVVDYAAFEAALDAVQDAYIAGYDAGDAAALAGLFADDGMMSPPLSPALDKAGIEAMYGEMFGAGASGALEVMREGYLLSGDEAVGWGSFAVTMTGPDGEPVTATGRYGSVMKKDMDGNWKLFRHMFNYEVPPPGFGQAM
jgi:uncharacterized protein (TIGR02246 family)